MPKSKSLAIALAMAVFATLGATTSLAGAASPAAKQTPVTIGMIESQTGAAASSCLAEITAAKAAVKVAQQAGIAKQFNVSINVQDDGSGPVGAVTAYRSLVNSNVPVIVGPCTSPATQAVVTFPARDKIPMVISDSSGPAFLNGTHPYVYGGGVSQSDYAFRTITELKKRGIKSTAVIVASDNPTIQALWNDVLKPALKKNGIQLLGEFPEVGGTVDFTAELTKIKSLNPASIGLMGSPPDNVIIARQARSFGLTQPFWSHLAAGVPVFQNEPAASGTLFTANWDPGFTYPSAVTFRRAVVAQGGTQPTVVSATGYDAMLRVMYALNSTGGKADSASINKALKAQKGFSGAEGPMTVDKFQALIGPGAVVQIENGVTHIVG
jgi:branched-chain amino acid transport system substrate-binding protein